jgi:hypothetical protein
MEDDAMNNASLAELKERILSRCEWQDGPLETPCLVFTGCLNSYGYGHIRFKTELLSTHRAIWMAEYGEIKKLNEMDERMEVCHLCDNPPCCEIKHLKLDTHQKNLKDAWLRGLLHDRAGQNSPRATLTDLQVSYIKFFIQQGWTVSMLAERYGVSAYAIWHIKLGKNWKHAQPFQPIDGEPLPVPPPIKSATPAYRRF